MGQLTNLFVSSSYQGLLKMTDSTNGLTNTLQTVQTGDGDNSPLQMSLTEVNISGSLTVNGQPITVNTGSLVTTASFNAYTSSVNTQLAGLDIETGSLQNQINGLASTGSLTSLSSSIAVTDLNQNNVIATLATTSSLTSLSSSIATTDLSQNNRLTSIEGITGSLATTSSLTSLSSSIATTDLNQNNVIAGLATTSSVNTKLDTGSFNSYTSSNDSKVNSLINATGSYATTGSNVFQGLQTISGSLIVTGSITALSASITYLQTVYQTSSIIFSSGSNILGDEAGDTQTLNGVVNIPLGNLNVTGATTSSLGFFGNLQGTASYATQALSASYAPSNPLPSGLVSGSSQISYTGITDVPSGIISGSVQISDLGFATTSSVIALTGSINSLNAATSSFVTETESGSFVTNVAGGPISFEDQIIITKGNGTTNTVTVNNVTNADSASYATNALTASFALNGGGGSINTGSFATTGSNTFYGNQTIISPNGEALFVSGALQRFRGNLFSVEDDNSVTKFTVSSTSNIILANMPISASQGMTGSLFGTSSYATQALSASYAPGVSIDTGSFAITGSNIFKGNQTLTGSFNQTGSMNVIGNPSNPSVTIARFGDPSYGVVDITGNGSLTATNTVYLTSIENWNTAGSSPISINNLRGDIIFYPKIATGSIIIGRNLSSKIQITGSLLSPSITGSLEGTASYAVQALSASYAPQTPLPSGLVSGSSQVSYTGITDVPVGLVSGSSQISDLGFAITGSNIFKGNQTISGSLLTNTLNNGLITIITEAQNSSSLAIPFGYITASNAISQSNLIFGISTGPNGNGQLTNNFTGSIVISGSNNIILGGNRLNTLVTAGTYGYLGGNGNIGSVIPTLGTGSILRPIIANNALQSGLSLQFITSSLVAPSFASNLIYGQVTINHQSSSIQFTNNIVGINLTSNANTTTLDTLPNIQANTIIGSTATLNHNSSSISYIQNVGAINVTNNYSSSVSATVNNITVNQNFAGGSNQQLIVSGSNSGTRRSFNSNFLMGRNNIANSFHSGSPFTGGHLVSTALIGQELIVSASHTSTLVGGTVIVGRYNATGSLQESSQETVFAVGTGTGAGARRTSLRIDNNGNTSINGVTNALTITGSATIQHSVAGQSALTVIAQSSDQPALTITGSLNVSGSGTHNIVGNQINITGNSTNIQGPFNVNGNTQLTGSLTVSNLPAGTGSFVITTDSNGTLNKAGYGELTKNLFSVAEFGQTGTLTAASGVSGSVPFDISGSVYGITLVSGSQITIQNQGTYNIQFSAQWDCSTGADTGYMWFKKNGGNITDSGTKVKMSNNTSQVMTVNILDDANTGNYYELVWQNAGGHAQLLGEASAAGVPAIPSVITTITQVR